MHAEPDELVWSADMNRTHPAISGYRGRVESTESCFNRLVSGDWASGELIDLAVAALYTRYPRRRDIVVALSTMTLTSWFAKASTPEEAYRHAVPYAPWNRQCVLIPLHAVNHWMLVALYPSVGVVEYFDSLGPKDDDVRMWCEVRSCRLWGIISH